MKWTLFLFANLFLCIAQAKVIVTGKLTNLSGQVNAYYYTPLDGFSNLYYNPSKIHFNKNLSFKFSLTITRPGFIFIELPTTRLKFFIGLNDSLDIQADYKKDVQNKLVINDVTIHGTNSAGNIICNSYQRILLEQALLANNLFAKKNYISIDDFFQGSKQFIDSLSRPIDSLYNLKAVDESFYKHVCSDIQGNLIFNIFNFYRVLISEVNSRHLVPFHKTIFATNSSLLTQKNFDSLRLLFYKQYNPKDSLLQSSTMGIFYPFEYYNDMYNGYIKKDITYDSSLSVLNKDNRFFGFMRGRILEVLWSNSIYWSAMDGMNSDSVKNNFLRFREKFPSSSFLPYLKRQIIALSKNQDNFNQDYKDDVVYAKNYTSYTKLDSLFATAFPGNYGFVDLWATWCRPCIQEFDYKNALDSFLQVKGVKLLYVSVDDVNSKDSWQQFIERKDLKGSHVLASEQLVADIKKEIFLNSSITIPRYLLINKEGKIIDKDLPRPSDMENLKKTINKLIQ